jgi:hypothetical protein
MSSGIIVLMAFFMFILGFAAHDLLRRYGRRRDVAVANTLIAGLRHDIAELPLVIFGNADGSKYRSNSLL